MQGRGRWLLRSGALGSCEAVLRRTWPLETQPEQHAASNDAAEAHTLAFSHLQLLWDDPALGAAADRAHQSMVTTICKCIWVTAEPRPREATTLPEDIATALSEADTATATALSEVATATATVRNEADTAIATATTLSEGGKASCWAACTPPRDAATTLRDTATALRRTATAPREAASAPGRTAVNAKDTATAPEAAATVPEVPVAAAASQNSTGLVLLQKVLMSMRMNVQRRPALQRWDASARPRVVLWVLPPTVRLIRSMLLRPTRDLTQADASVIVLLLHEMMWLHTAGLTRLTAACKLPALLSVMLTRVARSPRSATCWGLSAASVLGVVHTASGDAPWRQAAARSALRLQVQALLEGSRDAEGFFLADEALQWVRHRWLWPLMQPSQPRAHCNPGTLLQRSPLT